MPNALKVLSALSIVWTLCACNKSPSSSSKGTLSSAASITAETASVQNSKYTISSTMEILKPVNLTAMTNDAQTTEVLSEDDLTIKVKITVNPVADQTSGLKANPNWKTDYSKNSDLQKYLAAGITTNWDSQMKTDLLKALKTAGIEPDKLSDVELVQKVSKWIFGSPEFQFQDHFVSYDVELKDGKMQVIPEVQEHFESEKIKNNFPSEEAALEQGVLGKSMFYARKYGNCTYSATLQATVLKALGIPTRLVLMIPAVDWNDQAQWNMIRDNIHQHVVQKTVLQGLALQSVGSWGSHTFNEVYVGNKWVRLNYTNLGQKPADPQFFGLMLQVNEVSDWSEANLGRTWGIHAQAHNLVKLSSNNTFRSLELKDTAELLNDKNNPLPATPEIKTITLEKSFNSDDSSVPTSILQNLTADPSFAVRISADAQNPQYGDLAVFRRNVSREFLLKASGVPDVLVYEVGSWFESGFTAVKIKPQDMNQMADGVEYAIYAKSSSGAYKWTIDSSLKFVKPKGQIQPAPTPTTPVPVTVDSFSTQATVIKARTIAAPEMKCPNGKTCIVLELGENIDFANLQPVTDFYTSMPMKFSIKSVTSSNLPLSFYGITAVQQGKKVGFVFTIDEGLMASGIQYQVLNNSSLVQGKFSWARPANLTVTR